MSPDVLGVGTPTLPGRCPPQLPKPPGGEGGEISQRGLGSGQEAVWGGLGFPLLLGQGRGQQAPLEWTMSSLDLCEGP